MLRAGAIPTPPCDQAEPGAFVLVDGEDPMRPVYENPGFRLDISECGRDVTSGLDRDFDTAVHLGAGAQRERVRRDRERRSVYGDPRELAGFESQAVMTSHRPCFHTAST
jgi:hypothetical protein